MGDVYGHRRIFIIGAALFGVGSFIAATSTSVASLIVGEAIIEGLGASLLLPATLAILSGTFKGRERATAFAAWGATAGLAAACGPLVGGFLTTNFSWRWAFIINVIVAPLTIIGALLFMAPSKRQDGRVRIDVPGAVLVAAGMFLLVLGLSEGGRYGWWEPIKAFRIGSVEVWPVTAPISIVPVLFAVAAVLLTSFTRLELRKERERRDPLFEFSHLRHRTYRYGLLTGVLDRDGPARPQLRAGRVPPGRQAPLRPAERSLAAALGHLHHHRGAARRAPGQPVRRHAGSSGSVSSSTPSGSSSSCGWCRST